MRKWLKESVIAFLTVLLTTWQPWALAEILATGSLQKCIADGVTEELNCANKLVVTLTVGNGQSLRTEDLEFSLSCINSPDGQCPCSCSPQLDPGCACRDLAAPLRVSLTKSPLWASYPLQYLASFNWKPKEVILRPSNAVCKTCLSGQLKDLWEADLQRIATGRVPQYMVTQYTGGSDTTLSSFAGGPLSFALPVASQSASLVTLSVAADGVRLITNRSPGKISGARVCRFGDTSCGGFEAGASRGYVRANLTNTGRLAADFTLTLSNCSANVRPVEARALALPPNATAALEPPMELYVEDTAAAPNRTCWLTLYDAAVSVPYVACGTGGGGGWRTRRRL
ncbi:hypothetical protein GPECTOR_2g1324 [Gonium pectorale]|uniref:Generative cell specific-1/HAP2 domain-containing protein n=1 Tax=Gonium pectorale TaxID=33097 RepID=A0A150H152_GONPE|nr:hypothetical protein GPECTOR_2g1324 [Gonium pectorale]|eukprot:KXZ55774.1 hypothetical protein GPECTOR_2g1324 [Gonium pectorale]